MNKINDQPLLVIGLPGAGKKKYLLDKMAIGEIKKDDGSLYHYDEGDDAQSDVFIAELINVPCAGNEEVEKKIWEAYTPKVFNDKNKMIIVNHFEYNIQDAVSNRYKIEFLEKLFLDNKSKIIILSTIHPVAFLDSAMENQVKPEERLIQSQTLERWNVLLGHYRLVILPMQLHSSYLINEQLAGNVVNENTRNGLADVTIVAHPSEAKVFTMQDGMFILHQQDFPFLITVSMEGYHTKKIVVANPSELQHIALQPGSSFLSAQLIRQETNQTYFLKNTREPAFNAGRRLTEEMRIAKFDELAFKLQVSSHYFYMYIWQSLTKEEKFLLYDLAEDNLVNSFDDFNLCMLIAKGVVIQPDGTLKLFNKGFRNFILTSIGNSEAMKIKTQIKDNGNWGTLKIPLQLIIVAILAFLLTSQEQAFAKLITYVAALGAGVPAILKLFSLFDKSGDKPA